MEAEMTIEMAWTMKETAVAKRLEQMDEERKDHIKKSTCKGSGTTCQAHTFTDDMSVPTKSCTGLRQLGQQIHEAS